MFLKLFKHEFKSQAGLFGILSGAVMLVGVFGALMMWLFVDNLTDTEPIIPVFIIAYFLMLGAFMVIMAYSLAVNILLVVRFYRRLFSDEGYLTFTVPASSHQILLSGVLNNAIWSLISAVVVICASSLVFVPLLAMAFQMISGQVQDMNFIEIIRELIQEIRTDGVFEGMFDGAYIYFCVMAVLFFCSWLGNLILPLLAVTIGSVAVKRMKLLAGFGIYYGMEMTLSIATGIIIGLSEVSTFFIYDGMAVENNVLFLLIPAAVYLFVGVGGYFLMHHLVDKKLNLP